MRAKRVSRCGEPAEARYAGDCSEMKAPLFAKHHFLFRMIPVAQYAKLLLKYRAFFVGESHIIHGKVHSWERYIAFVADCCYYVEDLDRE